MRTQMLALLVKLLELVAGILSVLEWLLVVALPHPPLSSMKGLYRHSLFLSLISANNTPNTCFLHTRKHKTTDSTPNSWRRFRFFRSPQENN
jgi:hypothetical protein